MPIARLKPDAPSPIVPNQPKVEPKHYKSVIVDDSVTPFDSLLGYVSGAPWTVNYYSQLLSAHNDLREHDAGQTSVYQQYTKIAGLELRVGSPIDSNQDSDSALVKVSGSAVVYSYLIPNVGDMFVASVGDGENGLFRVSNVERKNFNRNSVFGIDYDLVNYISKDPVRFEDLEKKVNNTVYFDKTRLIDNASPVLHEEEYTHLQQLRLAYSQLVTYYFTSFYNKSVGTLILPGQTAVIYDGFLVDYLFKIVQSEDASEIRHTSRLDMGQDRYLQQKMFWDALLAADHQMLPMVSSFVGMVSCQAFSRNPTLKGLRFSRMEYVVYPIQTDKSLDPSLPEHAEYSLFTDLTDPGSGIGGLSSYIENLRIEANGAVPYIDRLLDHPTYVFGEAFYTGQPGQTVLESLTTDYLKRRMLSVKKLIELNDQCRRWGRLEQFYYIPVLLTLIKSATVSLY